MSDDPEEDDSDETIETIPALGSMSFEEGVRYLMNEGTPESVARELMAIALKLVPGDAYSVQELQRWERAAGSRRRRSA